VNILPVKNRYNIWFLNEFIKYAKKMKIKFKAITLDKKPIDKLTNYFTNEYEAIEYELEQIYHLSRKVKEDDKILWLDIDYPGFAVPASFLFKLRGVKSYGILHGAYFNIGDIWEPLKERRDFMRAGINVCGKVFVGSKYFKDCLVKNLDVDERKIVVTGLPFRYYHYKCNLEKENMISVTGKDAEELNIEGYKKFIARNKNYEEYMDNLSKSKYAIVWKKAETFGYLVLEAMAVGTIVLVPKAFSYVEWYEMLKKPCMMELCDSLYDCVNFIKTYNWSKEDMMKRYSNTMKLFKWLEESPKRILNEVIRE
jgi:glycosyltransferase involved in cell wall biosynthesis